jgi:uncharacterized delta-60 repeat protein
MLVVRVPDGLARISAVDIQDADEKDKDFGGFDNDHVVIIPNMTVKATTLQPDGKIIVVGYNRTNNTTRFAVQRYHPDGTLDSSFTDGGFHLSGVNQVATDVAVQPDGKIIVVGQLELGTYDFVVYRLWPNGDLDEDFGDSPVDGFSRTDFDGDNDYATSVALQPDGKIVVAGSATVGDDIDFAVARYKTNGSLDTTFNDGDGKVTTGFGAAGFLTVDNDYGYAVAIQDDDKIIVVGEVNDGTASLELDFGIVRYTSRGFLDETFDEDGKRSIGVGGDYDAANDVAIQKDGKIVLVGEGGDSDNAVVLLRLNEDGSDDPSFGTQGNGQVKTEITAENDIAYAVAIQSDGKIVIGGTSKSINTQPKSFIARYLPNGTPDTKFSTAGIMMGYSDAYAYDMFLQPDGKFVLTGDDILARYNPDGSKDVSGQVMVDFDHGSDRAYALAVQPDGKIIVVGEAETQGINDKQVALTRFNPDGTLDNSFGTGGLALAGMANDDAGRAIALTPTGKIVVAGVRSGLEKDFAVWRFNSDGTPDGSFGNPVTGLGFSVADFGFGDDSGQAILIQDDQGAEKTIVVGSAANGSGNTDFALARFNVNGTLDTSFGDENTGLVRTSVGIGKMRANAAALQPDGKIVIVGGPFNFIVARYNPDGTFDDSFGKGGIKEIGHGGNDVAFAVAVLPNGTIVVAGYMAESPVEGYPNGDFGLVFLDSDGNLCTSCGNYIGNVLRTDFGGSEVAFGMTVQPDGKILLAGANRNATTTSQFYLARYRYQAFPIGDRGYVLDPSFNETGNEPGKMAISITGRDLARAIALDSNNRILVAGDREHSNYVEKEPLENRV